MFAAAADGDNPPNVDTVTSYASGSGSMARMNVGGFLSLTRTALIGAQTRVDQAALAGMMNATGGAAGFDGASLDQDMLDSLPEGQVDQAGYQGSVPGRQNGRRIGQRYRREPSDRRGRYADRGVGKRCGYGGQRIRRHP